MDITDGHDAIIRRIVAMADGASVITPNDHKGGALPRYIVQEAGGSQRTFGPHGETEARPEIVVRCETESDTGTLGMKALIARLYEMFPVGERIEDVVILDAPSPRPPLPGDGIYAVPVLIRGYMSF